MITPEGKARLHIDNLLQQAGWVIQDRQLINLSASAGVAVREFQTTSGPADYILFINRKAAGVVEGCISVWGWNVSLFPSEIKTLTKYSSSNRQKVFSAFATPMHA